MKIDPHYQQQKYSPGILVSRKTSLMQIFAGVHHHDHHHTTGLTWCRHSSTSGPRYKVSVTHVVSVRKSGKTDTSSMQYRMMRRLALT